jgi:hypothetical protein
MNEQEHVIRSVEMAREMAYAEKPFRELAQVAFDCGRTNIGEQYIKNGEEASIVVAKELILQQTLDILHYDQSNELLNIKPVVMTKADLIKFEFESEKYHEKRPGQLPGKVWTAFAIGLVRNKSLSARFKDNLIGFDSEAGSEERAILLTRQLFDLSKDFNQMGPISRQFVEDYFAARSSSTEVSQ